MSQATTDEDSVLGMTPGDEGEKVAIDYQSLWHPDADKTHVEGGIIEVVDGYAYVRDEKGRVLEVTEDAVTIHDDEEGRYQDKQVGTDPEVKVKRLYEVYVDGVAVKHVRASDDQEARDIAIKNTDHGEMNDSTDRNAASRTNEDDVLDLGEIIE